MFPSTCPVLRKTDRGAVEASGLASPFRPFSSLKRPGSSVLLISHPFISLSTHFIIPATHSITARLFPPPFVYFPTQNPPRLPSLLKLITAAHGQLHRSLPARLPV